MEELVTNLGKKKKKMGLFRTAALWLRLQMLLIFPFREKGHMDSVMRQFNMAAPDCHFLIIVLEFLPSETWNSGEDGILMKNVYKAVVIIEGVQTVMPSRGLTLPLHLGSLLIWNPQQWL